MSDTTFKTTIFATIQNAERLLRDAEWALDCERFAPARMLAVLAQEEIAKALLLSLVEVGALPWSPEVQAALHNQRCEQFALLVLGYLSPRIDDLIRRHRSGTPWARLPSDVADAIHSIVVERLPREHYRWWVDPEDGSLEKGLKDIAGGAQAERRRDAIYVRVGSSGELVSTPLSVTLPDARAELDRAKQLEQALQLKGGPPRLLPPPESARLVDLFRLLTNRIPPDTFVARWLTD
jgi:hypothetical protein